MQLWLMPQENGYSYIFESIISTVHRSGISDDKVDQDMKENGWRQIKMKV